MAYTLSSSPKGVHFSSMAAPSLQALLTGAIDYAGLFPPATLPLNAALKNHAEYVRSDDAWMLSAFVLPVGKFSDVSDHLGHFEQQYPLRISALIGKPEDGGNFADKVSAAIAAIRGLRESDTNGRTSIAQIEIALPSGFDTALLGELQSISRELDVRIFCEAPPNEAAHAIALIAQNDTTKDAPLGYKLRTGGVTADAFPTSDVIARALVAAARDQVPIKFTAGLHHPIRQFRDEVKGKMYGFLNVLGAGVLAAEHSWDEAITAQMLEDEDPRSFVFDGGTFKWRNWQITAESIKTRRQLVTSFGSCSFDEPREDLRSLHLM